MYTDFFKSHNKKTHKDWWSVIMPNSRLYILHHVIDALRHHYETIFLVKLPKFLPHFSGKEFYIQELKKKKTWGRTPECFGVRHIFLFTQKAVLSHHCEMSANQRPEVSTLLYRITESQNGRGWKGPLWVI